ncbi:MAG: LemA family protein [Candidatus Paceibacterota bacterium]|jgi:LemA protein
MSILMIILVAVVAIVVLYPVFVYNRLVTMKNRVKEAWADIDVQLKRRYDLIPNLVETVKGYATHESGVFEKVTEARANALSAQGPAEKGKAENVLTDALKSVFAVAEAYPQLRAVESFTSLQTELSDTENKIQAARRFYNGNVRDFNTSIQTFPANMVAGSFGFGAEAFFQLEAGSAEKEPVAVKF